LRTICQRGVLLMGDIAATDVTRLMSPEICKRNRDWAKLSQDGQDLTPDGTQIMKGERKCTHNPRACITQFSVPNRPDAMITTCGTPGGQ